MPSLATALRRLERRGAQAPTLIEPVVRAIDAALTALEEARGHLEGALRAAEYDPKELERIEERLFALRAAGRKYNVPVDAAQRSRHALRRRTRLDRCRSRAARRTGEETHKPPPRAIARRRKCSRSVAASAALKLDKAVNAELKPLKLERARFSTEIAKLTSEGRTASTASNSGCAPILARGRGR